MTNDISLARNRNSLADPAITTLTKYIYPVVESVNCVNWLFRYTSWVFASSFNFSLSGKANKTLAASFT